MVVEYPLIISIVKTILAISGKRLFKPFLFLIGVVKNPYKRNFLLKIPYLCQFLYIAMSGYNKVIWI